MIEKPKKERRFLKALGRVGEILIQEVLIKIGSNLIKKIGGKKTLPSILFLLASLSLFAQYPATGNKQRLGYQTTGDGLVFRGRASDTTTIKSSGLNNAYFILDTINNVLFNYIKTKGGWQFSNGDTIIINNNFTQPFDSLFFKTSVPTNNVDTAKMRWDTDLGTVVLGMYDKVPNELGFKNFWLVKNQTGSTITKGSIVYANGTVGASGRITVAKFIANGSIDAKYLLGITAHDLTDGEDGYVISFGKIRQVNTDTFTAGAILYPSPTTAGVWTDVEPVAPNIDMPIGFCINSSVNNGTIAIRVASGYKLSELHDVSISSPVENSSLYYKSGLWRDTTSALLVSDTANMLTPYLRKLDTVSLSNRINLKLNISDTLNMLTPYFRDLDTTNLNLTSRFASKLNLLDTATMLSNYLRSGIAASTYQAKLNGIGLVYANGTNISYDNSTYLTTGTAASTYLPLIGGTVSGTINRQEGANDGSANTLYYNILNYFARRDNVKGGATAQITFTDRPGTYNFPVNVRTSDIYLMTAKSFNGSQLGQFLDTTLSVVANQDGGRIGISKLNPAYKLDVNGTLGVTGATTLSSTLAVTGNITEGGNNVLTNLDTASLSSRIDGKVSLTATESIGGTKTFNNLVNIGNQMTISGSVSGGNILLGKNTNNNGVADITLGTGLSISSNVLNAAIPTERYYFDLGIVAGAADNSAQTYDFTYGSNIFIVPTSLNGYCIDSVYIRAIGCSTCPPVSPDLDYYVGVYKANAGARVATSGATLVGSQISMNEYDLNQVNRNDTLSTGEAWWVYLNGTYTSDLAYITAGFIVKKTCN